jgi:hypothetical protein
MVAGHGHVLVLEELRDHPPHGAWVGLQGLRKLWDRQTVEGQ